VAAHAYRAGDGEQPYQPFGLELGHRHPVTRLARTGTQWGRWLRQIDGERTLGKMSVMTAKATDALLILNRVGKKGALALMASDHARALEPRL